MLRVYETNSKMEVVVDQNVTINWNATAEEFCSKLKTFSWYSSTYGTTCSLKMKNIGGGITTIASEAVEFVWRVTIPKYRSDTLRAHVFKATYSSGNGHFTQSQVQDHSPPLSGTFTLDIGGVSIKLKDTQGQRTVSDIPYNVNAVDLRDAIRVISGM